MEQTALEYLREVVSMTYGSNKKNFSPVFRDPTFNSISKRNELKETLCRLLDQVDKMSFPSETVPVEIFSVVDVQTMTGTPSGYVSDLVNVPSKKAMGVYLENFIAWVDKKIPTKSRIDGGKFFTSGFDPAQVFRQYRVA